MIMPTPSADRLAAVKRFVVDLLAADWNDPAGPLRFNDRLALFELACSPFFLNARCLLRALAAAGGTPATAASNLNRAFVQRVADLLVMSDIHREAIHAKALNEQELNTLHFARVVCQCGKLIAYRQKRFTVTRRGRDLLPDDQAGPLYRHLFIAHFRQFNLGYRFTLRDVPGIQHTMAVILWRLASIARDWTPVAGLAEQVLLPPVCDQLHAAHFSQYDTDAWILAGYALNPLLEFGLIEKQKASDWPGVDEKDHIRVSDLFRRFISFPREP